MPLLDIEIITHPGERLSPTLAIELANRAGEVFDAPAGTTWVKLRAIAPEHYAESGAAASERPFPVFVSVLKAKTPAPDEMRAEVARLTAAIAQVCARPAENVHVLYLPEGGGRIAFGGKIIPAR